MMKRFIFLISFLAFSITTGNAQKKISIGFYNVENLYDTIPSTFYDDTDYTPSGKLKWDTERYNSKISNLARVIDDMELDILGLAEVENETVIRDLIMALETDYNYIHLTGSDRRGIDLAMLYKGDILIPEHFKLVNSGVTREFLYVRGELAGNRIDIIICHLPSQLNKRDYRERAMVRLYNFADSLHRSDNDSRIIIMGDFNSTPTDKLMRRNFHTPSKNPTALPLFYSPLESSARQGKGTYVYNNRWRLYDNIFISRKLIEGNEFRYLGQGIFIRPYMVNSDMKQRHGYPFRTFSGSIYQNGYSDHLPVYIVIDAFEQH